MFVVGAPARCQDAVRSPRDGAHRARPAEDVTPLPLVTRVATPLSQRHDRLAGVTQWGGPIRVHGTARTVVGGTTDPRGGWTRARRRRRCPGEGACLRALV